VDQALRCRAVSDFSVMYLLGMRQIVPQSSCTMVAASLAKSNEPSAQSSSSGGQNISVKSPMVSAADERLDVRRQPMTGAQHEAHASRRSDLVSGKEAKTTVMLRNVPANYTRAMLLQLLDGSGFARRYDFVYLPMDFKTTAGLGYAFVNLVDAHAAAQFWTTFEGFRDWGVRSGKVASLGWATPHQGLAAYIERFRNSSIMSPDTPDAYKPALLQDGVVVSFPAAVQSLRAFRPRPRRHK